MGTLDRDRKHSGSLVEGLTRRVGATEPRPPLPGVVGSPCSACGAPAGTYHEPGCRKDELPELGSFGHVPGMPARQATSSPAMLGFFFDQSGYWCAMPQRPFKPRGLYIVGELTTGDRLTQALLGYELQLLQSCEGVPAHFFATARSYEQIAKAVADGHELPGWGEWKHCYPGQRFMIRVTSRHGDALGPDRIDLGMWGHSLL